MSVSAVATDIQTQNLVHGGMYLNHILDEFEGQKSRSSDYQKKQKNMVYTLYFYLIDMIYILILI